MDRRVSTFLLAMAAWPAAVGLTAPAAHLEGEFKPERWQFVHDWETGRQTGTEYGHALDFAECVSRFDADAPSRIMSRPLQDAGQRRGFLRLAERYRGCGRRVAVSPFLLRAAFAELMLRNSADTALRPATTVGIPARVQGYPIATVAACHVRAAPDLVAQLLRTRPGGTAEEEAASRLFAGTARCPSPGPVMITPTAVRLAVVHAAHSERL